MFDRLLIVDDSPVMRSFLRRAITSAGIEVAQYCEAGNGAEALDLLEKQPVDLVLTDINMPVLDGAGLVDRLRRNPKLQSIPVVVVSTDSTAPRMAELMQLGARGYLRKPFAPEQLIALLDELFPSATGAN